MRFKVGDRVKILGGYSNIPDVAYGKYGRIQFVIKCDVTMPYCVRLDKKVKGKSCYWATEKDLEAVHESINEPEDKENMQRWKIEIVSTGDKTTAKLYALGRVIREVSVTRYYKDDYSTEVAAKEAMKKLFEPHRFTGKAMFVGNPDKYWGGLTYGKIYCFIDGICVDDNGNKRCATTLEPDSWGYGDFIKVVE